MSKFPHAMEKNICKMTLIMQLKTVSHSEVDFKILEHMDIF